MGSADRERSALAIGRLCAIDGCNRGGIVELSYHGWVCNLHYQRHRKYGSFEKQPKHLSRFVQCAWCGVEFDRGYAINSKRAANPQYCSSGCRADALSAESESGAEDRFWSYVDRRGPEECWEWKGHRTEMGYGRFTWRRGRTQMAHRIAYHFTKGDPRRLFVCHRCDNPPCCNPNHLWLGTHRDNMADMVRKGRNSTGPTRIGEDHPCSKLTIEQARRVKYGDEDTASLAQSLGVTKQAIALIRAGKNWGWL